MSGSIAGQPSQVWQPSSSRRIVLDGFLPLPRGSIPASPQLFAWPAKDPGDTLDYEINISEALIGNDYDTVAAAAVAISPHDTLVAGTISADGPSAVVWLSGGLAGTTYAVQMRITTQTGRVIARTVLLPVQALAPPIVPVPSTGSLTTLTGAVVSDQSGAPILVSG